MSAVVLDCLSWQVLGPPVVEVSELQSGGILIYLVAILLSYEEAVVGFMTLLLPNRYRLMSFLEHICFNHFFGLNYSIF